MDFTLYRLVCIGIQSVITALILGYAFLKCAYLFRAKSREYVPVSHKVKDDTPTMGGLFVVLSIVISSLSWCQFFTLRGFLALFLLVAYACIGLADDWLKISQGKGITERTKSVSQIVVAGVVLAVWLYVTPVQFSMPSIFFVQSIYLGWFLPIWALFIIVGTSNAVNLTDGLDGLAAGSLISNYLVFALIACCGLLSDMPLYSYDIAIVSIAAAGSCLGFLWYNAYPARLFMGDVGSLSLGGLLGFIAILLRAEAVLALTGLIFVIETLSVIAQVLWYKKYRSRLFKLAPIHHHFELIGYQEKSITFWATVFSSSIAFTVLVFLSIF